MLTAEMKAELARALATSAIGYAKMSCADHVKNDNNQDSDTRNSNLLSYESTGPLRKRKLLSISGNDQSSSRSNFYCDNKKQKSTQAMHVRNSSPMNPIIMDHQDPNLTINGNRRAREARLEQNRIAARKSRFRKKTNIHNCQHSIMYYTRANAALQQENDTLEKMLDMAREFVNGKGEIHSEPNENNSRKVEEVVPIVTQQTIQVSTNNQGPKEELSHPKIEKEIDNESTCAISTSEDEAKKPLPEIAINCNHYIQNNKPTSKSVTAMPKSPHPYTVYDAEEMDGNVTDKDTEIVESQAHIIPPTQNHLSQSFSTAAACAANLQVAAANFQAAIVASMGNPLLNQMGTHTSTSRLIIQNYPLLMPFLLGSASSPGQLVPQDGQSDVKVLTKSTSGNSNFFMTNEDQTKESHTVKGKTNSPSPHTTVYG